MNYRLAKILASTAYTTDKTEIIDIDVADPISQLIIVFALTNGAVANAAGHPAECVTKIELVDGADVLFSLSGVEAEALDFFHNKVVPYSWFRYLNANTAERMIIINFGRHLWDTMLAFDPTKFTNPQLKITLDIDAGGCNTSANNLRVFAHLFDEKKITPVGFLMAKEIKDFTLANNAHEYTDLPTDHPFRKLLIRAQRDDYQPDQQLANVKLSEDVDKRVICDLTMEEMIDVIANTSPQYLEQIIGAGSTALRYFFCTPGHAVAIAGAAWRTTATGNVTFYGGGGGYFSQIQEAAGPNWQAHVRGYCPHSVVELPFGDQQDIEDWFNVAEIGNLKLDLTGGSSVGTSQTAQIFLQQLRRYA